MARAASVALSCFVAFSTAWTLALLVSGASSVDGTLMAQLFRWSVLLGIGVGLAAWRGHGRSTGRTFLECLLLAAVLQEVAFALWVGARLLPDVAGAAGAGPPWATWERVVEMHHARFYSLSFWAGVPAFAVGVLLAARRLDRRSAGLVLVAPIALAELADVALVLAFDTTLALAMIGAQALCVLLAAVLVPLGVALADRVVASGPAA